MEISWRPLVKVKSILRMVEIFLAIMAFSLTASFSIQDVFSFTCEEGDFITLTSTVLIKTDYPFSKGQLTSNDTTVRGNFHTNYHSGPEFFVSWGVVSMIYCMVALLIYVFVTPNKSLAKFTDVIIIGDFGASMFIVLFWFISSVVWAAGSHNLQDDLERIVTTRVVCISGTTQRVLVRDFQSFVQINISLVFGFFSFLVWAANLWWLFKETYFYQKLCPGLQPTTGFTNGAPKTEYETL